MDVGVVVVMLTIWLPVVIIMSRREIIFLITWDHSSTCLNQSVSVFLQVIWAHLRRMINGRTCAMLAYETPQRQVSLNFPTYRSGGGPSHSNQALLDDLWRERTSLFFEAFSFIGFRSLFLESRLEVGPSQPGVRYRRFERRVQWVPASTFWATNKQTSRGAAFPPSGPFRPALTSSRTRVMRRESGSLASPSSRRAFNQPSPAPTPPLYSLSSLSFTPSLHFHLN